VQAAVEEVLARRHDADERLGRLRRFDGYRTGEIIAMASLPDFDPNARPRPLTEGDQADSPLFNRAVQGVYELGSVFKTFTIAQAMEAGSGEPRRHDRHARAAPHGGFRDHRLPLRGAEQSVADVFTYSSNIGTARIARMIGGERQQEFPGSPRPDGADRAGTGGGAERPAALSRPLGRVVDDDDLLRPRHLHLARAPGRRLCRDGQWRHDGHADASAPRPGSEAMPEGERVISRPISARMRSCCGRS
jgi:hypothetical protein